ncbi:MAG: hypothetical protein JO099_04855 [Acidobacteriia bacterium]|nr:hypothetical protein [Terriglobia bacterium]
MTREEAEKLLGGYATGTLTAEEREALFQAALEHQEIFDALAGEEPLRAALQDPTVRARLLVALEDAPKPWYYRDVHSGIIAATAATILIVTFAVRFWPVKVAPPIDVVARPELPQPTKSALPTELPTDVAARRPTPKLPKAPVIGAMPGSAGATPAVRAAVEKLLAEQSSTPLPPAAPVALARNTVAPRAMAFSRLVSAPVATSLRSTVLKKLPNGEFAPVDANQDLEATDETVTRFVPSERGYLYVLEKTVDGWQRIASLQVEPLVTYTLPPDGTFRDLGTGPRVFQAVFSRQPLSVPERAAVGGVAARPAQVPVTITLKYPAR